MGQAITVGRIVLYTLTADQAAQVNRRREPGAGHTPSWPKGAQAHVGNHATEGDVLPLLVCRVWPNEGGQGKDGVNGQCFLDGNDQLWITSALEGTGPGTWAWPQRG